MLRSLEDVGQVSWNLRVLLLLLWLIIPIWGTVCKAYTGLTAGEIARTSHTYIYLDKRPVIYLFFSLISLTALLRRTPYTFVIRGVHWRWSWLRACPVITEDVGKSRRYMNRSTDKGYRLVQACIASILVAHEWMPIAISTRVAHLWNRTSRNEQQKRMAYPVVFRGW